MKSNKQPCSLWFLLALSSFFEIGCYPHKEYVSHEIRPVLNIFPEPVHVSSEELAKHTPKEFLSELLPNGMRVSIRSDWHSPTVAIRVFYQVGSAHDDKSTLGLAHLFEHLMFGATKNYPKRFYDEYIHRYGGHKNATTYLEQTVYESEIEPEHHEKILEMEAERMVNLLLTEEAFRTEKKVVAEELRAYDQNPLVKIGIPASRKMMNGHPYAYYTGSIETVMAATLEQAEAFYRRYYGPKNVHLVVVGPVEPKSELEMIKRYFAAIPAAGTTPQPIPKIVGWPFPVKGEFSQDLFPAKGALLVYPLPSIETKDTVALQLMSQILCPGGLNRVPCPSKTTLPYRNLVKNQKVAVEAGISMYLQRSGGAAYFYAAYLPYRREKTAFRLLEETRDHLAQLDWLTDVQLEGAKKALLKNLYSDSHLSSEQAESIGNAYQSYGDARYAFYQPELIRSVTRADVERVFRRYILEQTPVKVYITPEKVPAWLTLFGWLYPLVAK